ncbi:hypothetical protein EV361DRAFT_872749 [Lentinula raphanica]|nr:hypothetical protein EV361DRAFT_872749 [Lentinula raphanica]
MSACLYQVKKEWVVVRDWMKRSGCELYEKAQNLTLAKAGYPAPGITGMGKAGYRVGSAPGAPGPTRATHYQGVLSYLVYYNKFTSRSYAALHKKNACYDIIDFGMVKITDESKRSYIEILATSGTSKLPKKAIGLKIELDLIR